MCQIVRLSTRWITISVYSCCAINMVQRAPYRGTRCARLFSRGRNVDNELWLRFYCAALTGVAAADGKTNFSLDHRDRVVATAELLADESLALAKKRKQKTEEDEFKKTAVCCRVPGVRVWVHPINELHLRGLLNEVMDPSAPYIWSPGGTAYSVKHTLYAKLKESGWTYVMEFDK